MTKPRLGGEQYLMNEKRQWPAELKVFENIARAEEPVIRNSLNHSHNKLMWRNTSCKE